MLANNIKVFIQRMSENTIPDISNWSDKEDISFIARGSHCSSQYASGPGLEARKSGLQPRFCHRSAG